MYKSKFLSLLTVAILVGTVLSSANAQRKLTPQPIVQSAAVQGLSGTLTIDVRANELSNGDTTFSGANYGWTCYGKTTGDLSGHIFMSVNYAATVASPYGGEIRQVIGGSWSKLIFIKGVYMGSIYGKIVGGQMVSGAGIAVTEVPTPVTLSLQLTAEGGTGSYVDDVGTGSFEGVFDYEQRGANVVGTLTLNC